MSGSWPILLLALVIVLAPSASVVASLQDPDDARFPGSVVDVLPQSTVAYATVTLDQESSQWQLAGTLLDRLGQTQPFALYWMQSLLRQQIADALPYWFDAPSFDQLQGTQITVAVTDLRPALEPWSTSEQSAADGEVDQGIIVLIQPVDPVATMSVITNVQDQHAREHGLNVTTEFFDGYSLRSAGETNTDQRSVIAGAQQFILVAASASDLEPVLSTIRGEQPSLASLASHANVTARLQTESLLSAWINGTVLREQMTATQLSPWLDVSGSLATANASTGMVLWADEPGFRLDTYSALDQSLATPSASPAALPADPATLTMADRAPADALFFANGTNLGNNQPMLLLLAMFLTGMEPSDLAQFGETPEAFLTETSSWLAADLGFDPMSGLLQHLTGEFSLSVAVGNLAAPGGLDVLLASVVDDPAAVQATVSTIADKVRPLLDNATTLIEGSGLEPWFEIEDVLAPFNLAADGIFLPDLPAQWGVTDNTFVVGAGDAIDGFVAGPPAPLSSNATYQQALGMLPSDPTSVIYADITRILELVQAVTGPWTNSGDLVDAHHTCAAFIDQSAAQSAFDADPAGHRSLDEDFDMRACEDFPFALATPAGTAVTGTPTTLIPGQITVAMVEYVLDDGTAGTSSILLIN